MNKPLLTIDLVKAPFSFQFCQLIYLSPPLSLILFFASSLNPLLQQDLKDIRKNFKINLNHSMFSSTLLVSKSSASIHRVVTSQRLTVRLFNNQLGGSASTSPSSSLLASSHNTGSGEESKRSSIFDFLVKSVSSGVVAVGIGSLLCLNSSTSNSNVSFADFQKETKWTMKEDQFQYPFPNQNARKKSKFLFGGKNVHQLTSNFQCFPKIPFLKA